MAIFILCRCCFLLNHHLLLFALGGHDVDEAHTLRIAPCPRMAGPCAFMHVRVRYDSEILGTTSHDDGVSSRLVPSRFVSSGHCQMPHQCMLACLLVLLTSKCRTSGCVPFEAQGE
ncbi:hypothetical protein HDV57DRAFT_192390 [Trichoderma longibrachiatum]|uniref:Secreted protein n=1 Tax=Trichoderma longibrachiatum ATCC 18648 TaxID=983965 RepID=A0A2T4BYV0_TRILO|nr:hypothetical protein M440DRAFT_96360 [Trichoderma longibrachiatum ATCC 18648]